MDALSILVLVLSLVAAARYSYWVVESIPTVFVPALAIAVWWMAERGQRALGWAVAAMIAGFSGSVLSKVTTAPVLVMLGGSVLWKKFWLLPYTVRAAALAVAGIAGIYCALMLLHFLPLFLAMAPIGPESFRNPEWWFRSRDIGALLLAALVWFIADAPVAFALCAGFASFLLYSFVFQINFVCGTILVGIIAATTGRPSALARQIAFVAFVLSLPAVIFSDPAGRPSGLVWIFCMGGAGLVATLNAVQLRRSDDSLTSRMPLALGFTTLVILAFGLVGVARGSIIVNSGWNRLAPPLTPELRDIWSAVRRLTPENALIFTDQVDETINLTGGWNTYALAGQRQIYLSSYYTNIDLRTHQDRLREVLAINQAVLDGLKSPSQVPTRSHYEHVFAVMSATRTVPDGWKTLYRNRDYAILRIVP